MGVGLKRSEVRVCRTCGRQFSVGKQEKHRKANVYCSRRCKQLDQPVLCKKLSPGQAGYLAGLLDGEGSIIALKRVDGSVKSYRLQIVNTHQGVLGWCVHVTGIGVVHHQTTPKFSLDTKRPNAHLTYKPCFAWAVYGVKAASVLRRILPYLHIKRDRAEVALEAMRP